MSIENKVMCKKKISVTEVKTNADVEIDKFKTVVKEFIKVFNSQTDVELKQPAMRR